MSGLAPLLLALQGVALVELLAGVRRFGVGAACAAALPLGVVSHAVLTLPLVLVGCPAGPITASVEAALLLVAAGVVHRRRGAAPVSSPPAPPWSGGERAAAGAIGAVLALLAAIAALEPPVEWDVAGIWGFKARVLAAGGDGLVWLSDPARAYFHPDYPLAWPLALALDPALAGAPPRGGAGLLGIGMLAAAGGCAAVLAGRWGRRAALAAAALVATLPLAGAQAVRLLADLPLAALFTLAVGAFLRGGEVGDRKNLAVAAVATAGLPLVKQEGLALGVAAVVVALVRAPRGGRRRVAGALAAAVAVVDLPWLAVRLTLPAGADNSFADMTLARALAGIERLPAIVAALPTYLGAIADWGGLWFAVVLTLPLLARHRDRDRATTGLAWFLAAPLPLYLAALLAGAWPIERLLEVTLARLALHFAPLAAALLAAMAAGCGVFGHGPAALPAAPGGPGAEERAAAK